MHHRQRRRDVHDDWNRLQRRFGRNCIDMVGDGGSLPFSLIYAECCGGPAVLETNLVGPENPPVTTPEPATLLLLGLGLGVAGLGFRRRRKLS